LGNKIARPEGKAFQFNTEGIGPETEGFQLNQCPTRGTPVLHEGGPNVALPKEDFNQPSTREDQGKGATIPVGGQDTKCFKGARPVGT